MADRMEELDAVGYARALEGDGWRLSPPMGEEEVEFRERRAALDEIAELLSNYYLIQGDRIAAAQWLFVAFDLRRLVADSRGAHSVASRAADVLTEGARKTSDSDIRAWLKTHALILLARTSLSIMSEFHTVEENLSTLMRIVDNESLPSIIRDEAAVEVAGHSSVLHRPDAPRHLNRLDHLSGPYASRPDLILARLHPQIRWELSRSRPEAARPMIGRYLRLAAHIRSPRHVLLGLEWTQQVGDPPPKISVSESAYRYRHPFAAITSL